jgi:chaperonin GroEL
MIAKDIVFHDKARTDLKTGIDLLANAVKVTLGPKGRNVVIYHNGNTNITKDGVTVANSINLEEGLSNIGAQIIKRVADKTEDNVGDGTTTATVLAQAMITQGLKYVYKGSNPLDIKKGMDKALEVVLKEIDKASIPINDSDDKIRQVATISANNDEEIGDIIDKVIDVIKKDGSATIRSSQDDKTYIEKVEGIRFPRTYLSDKFITNEDTLSVKYDSCFVLAYNNNLVDVNIILDVLEFAMDLKKPLLIIVKDIDKLVLDQLAYNHKMQKIKIAIVQAPEFGKNQDEIMQDIAIATGGLCINRPVDMKGLNMQDILGEAGSIEITKSSTTIIDGKGDVKAIADRIEYIKTLIKEDTVSDYLQDVYTDRLAKLTAGIAIIRVGGVSEIEMEEKKDRIQDALNATKAALKEGIVPGGGVMLARASRVISKIIKTDNEDETFGANIMTNALTQPLKTIVENAGYNGEVIFNKILEGSNYNWGFNAKTNTYEDLVSTGIIDPKKVTVMALKNATSIASMFLTTECVINITN